MNLSKKSIRSYLNNFNETPGRIIEISLGVINLLACIIDIFSTYSFSPQVIKILFLIELVIVIFFTVEYILRIWVSEKRLDYLLSFYGIIDLLSIIPVIAHGSGFLRVLRLFRVFRFLRFLKTEKFFFGTVSIINLQTIRIFFTIFTILFLSAGFIHYIEHRAEYSEIHTFGDAFYFSVITLTTVGYGDITPATPMGRWVTVFMILTGVICISWQAGLLIKHFIRSEQKKRQITCKHCGLMYHEQDATYCKACGNIIYQEYEGS